jgi:hypothetical protein
VKFGKGCTFLGLDNLSCGRSEAKFPSSGQTTSKRNYEKVAYTKMAEAQFLCLIHQNAELQTDKQKKEICALMGY